MSGFSKAKKSAAKLRLGLMGISGGGKTWTALEIASGIGGRIALIDTENASASKYADRFDFDTLQLKEHYPVDYVAAMKLAQAEGYDIVIIDSMSQAWDKTKDIADAAGKRMQGNTFAGWKDASLEYKKLTDAIIHSPIHVIGTMRAKTEYAQDVDKNGKKMVKKLGLGAEAGKNIEYEFDIMLEMEDGGRAIVGKSRFDKWTGKVFQKPGKEFGQELGQWLSDGPPAEAAVFTPPAPAPVAKPVNNQPNIVVGKDFTRFAAALDTTVPGQLDVVIKEIADAKSKGILTEHEVAALRQKLEAKRAHK